MADQLRKIRDSEREMVVSAVRACIKKAVSSELGTAADRVRDNPFMDTFELYVLLVHHKELVGPATVRDNTVTVRTAMPMAVWNDLARQTAPEGFTGEFIVHANASMAIKYRAPAVIPAPGEAAAPAAAAVAEVDGQDVPVARVVFVSSPATATTKA